MPNEELEAVSHKEAMEIAQNEQPGTRNNALDIWNQFVANFANPEPQNHNSTPVTILGKQYHNKDDHNVVIQSKILLTYRFGFEPIPRAIDGPSPLSFAPSVLFNRSVLSNLHALTDMDHFSNDIGWGCMIRTSQMLVANCYLRLGGKAAQIVHMFQDNSACAFSIHNFIRVAAESPLKVKPGEWFGPNAASVSIRKLCQRTPPDVPPLQVLVSESCDLYRQQIITLLQDNEPLLILLPARLGIDRINPYYYRSLKQLLALPQSVGIAGGKPSSSFYFLGFRDDELIYLDPHRPQQYTADVDQASYHTLDYHVSPIEELDPSMLIGVLITTLEDYEKFVKECTDEMNKIVHFHDEAPVQQRKNSEFVQINHSDVPGTDADSFVELEEEVEDFGVVELDDYEHERNTN